MTSRTTTQTADARTQGLGEAVESATSQDNPLRIRRFPHPCPTAHLAARLAPGLRASEARYGDVFSCNIHRGVGNHPIVANNEVSSQPIPGIAWQARS